MEVIINNGYKTQIASDGYKLKNGDLTCMVVDLPLDSELWEEISEGTANWHYPEKNYRFFVPYEISVRLSIERPFLPVWIKQQGMLYYENHKGAYIYAGHLENVVFGDNTYTVDEILTDLTVNFGVVFEQKPT